MPYVLPSSLTGSNRMALVLAFGRLSVLEACSTVRGIAKVEEPCERVCVVEINPSSVRSLVKLAGIHKFSPLMAHFLGDEATVGQLVGAVTKEVDVSRFALSAYDTAEADYEALVRMLLDAFRAGGFRKIRLLRPKGDELMADEVVSRQALDIIAFPYKGGYGLGPTAWVPDAASMRQRGVAKPAPRSEISLSPRLAQLLLNLSGLSPGQTLLDPFCGSGTILAEGMLRSLRCVGVDSSTNHIRDARRNLGWAKSSGGRSAYTLKLGDARDLQAVLGGTRVDGVVTEPVLLPRMDSRPSTRVAGELMEAAGETYARALSSIATLLKPGSRVVVVVPVVRTREGSEVSISLDSGSLGLKQFQPGPVGFQYPVRLSFESTRWVRRAVYVFESRR